MLFRDLDRDIPAYELLGGERENIQSQEAFGSSSGRRTSERAYDQNQGRTAEYVVAKHLKNNYEDDEWVWLDDVQSSSYKHDFLFKTDEGWASIDVKSRRVNGNNDKNVQGIPTSYQDDPDFFGRHNVNKNAMQAHVDNHVYMMVALHDDASSTDEIPYKAGSVVGVTTATELAECDEYRGNPDSEIYKQAIPSSELHESSDLARVAEQSIQDVQDNGGFPSVAEKILNEEYSNIAEKYKDEIRENEKYSKPHTYDSLTEDMSMDVSKIDTDTTVEIDTDTYEPIMFNPDYEDVDRDSEMELTNYYMKNYGSLSSSETSALKYLATKEDAKDKLDEIMDAHDSITYSTLLFQNINQKRKDFKSKGMILDVIPHDEFGSVYKMMKPCGKSNCSDCPHGPYLYNTNGDYICPV
jgi:hypothetical protein